MLDLIADVGNVFLLVNVVLYLIGFFKHGRAYKIFSIYLVVIFMIQMMVSLLQYYSLNNLYLSHFYFVSQCIILSFFYHALHLNGLQKKIMKTGNVLAFFVLGIQYALDPSLFFQLNLLEIFITSFLVIVYATFHLYNLLTRSKEFYFVTFGVLLYLFGSTLIFLAGNLSISYHLRFVFSIWILNAALYVVYQWFILLEWIKNYSKSKVLVHE